MFETINFPRQWRRFPPRPNAPVSMSITWPQVKRDLDPMQYTIHTVPQLLKNQMHGTITAPVNARRGRR